VTIVVNTMPVAYDQNLETDEDVALAITLTADYITPGPALWTVLTPPTNGALSGTGANLVYTPDQDWYGTDSFTFQVNDGMYDSNIATITIEVLPVNDSPNAMDDFYETDMDMLLTVDEPGVLANDFDVDPTDEILAELKTEPLHGTLVFDMNGSFTYMPDANYFGVDSFEYYMLATPERDSELADWATVYITVHAPYHFYLPLFSR